MSGREPKDPDKKETSSSASPAKEEKDPTKKEGGKLHSTPEATAVPADRARKSSQVLLIGDVIAEKRVVVTNEEQYVVWEGYGLQLHIPSSSLPEGQDHFNLNIAVGLPSGKELLPSWNVLVSAMYSFSHDLRQENLSNPVKLGIQHCSHDIRHLNVVKCNHPSQVFSVIKSGSTTFTKDHCEIEVCSFSIYAITVFFRELFHPFASPFQYCCKVFYTSISYGQFHSEVCVFRNLDVLAKVIEAQISKRETILKIGVPAEVKFQESTTRKLRLDVPTELIDGWKFQLLSNRLIEEYTVNRFTDRKVFCPCVVRLKWEGEGEAKPLFHSIIFNGAKENFNSICIESPEDSLKKPSQHGPLKSKPPKSPSFIKQLNSPDDNTGLPCEMLTPDELVRKSMEDIIRSLKATPSAKETLVIKFKQEGWIDTIADCSETQLVVCALEQIRQNPYKFKAFVLMLRDTVGTTDIAEKLERQRN